MQYGEPVKIAFIHMNTILAWFSEIRHHAFYILFPENSYVLQGTVNCFLSVDLCSPPLLQKILNRHTKEISHLLKRIDSRKRLVPSADSRITDIAVFFNFRNAYVSFLAQGLDFFI